MPEIAQSDITLKELAQALHLELKGDGNSIISSVASFANATPQDLCFLQSKSYLKQLHNSQCAAVIVPLGFNEDAGNKNLLYSKNPHLSFVKTIHLLKLEESINPSRAIHASVQVAESVELGKNVSIGAHTVIADGVSIADDVTIGAACVIEQGVSIGQHTLIHSGVVLCHDVVIGERVILHPGVVIGSDGFGLVYDEGDWLKIPHLGRVIIGDRVEIGANTTVDRGALDDTIIENGVKLDNLIQVAHNVRIGENTAIAACVGIAGSANIGRNCKISGGAGILGHLSIADNVTITAMSVVSKSINESGTYSSGTPLMENRLWHKNNARYKILDKLARTVADLEKHT